MYMFFNPYNAKIKKIERDRTVLYLIRIMYQEPKSTNKLIISKWAIILLLQYRPP
jgi:hypothetical protein